jgi:hypothetical protein
MSEISLLWIFKACRCMLAFAVNLILHASSGHCYTETQIMAINYDLLYRSYKNVYRVLEYYFEWFLVAVRFHVLVEMTMLLELVIT